jgi:uncharacterized protein YjbJ (UPF0337 family)
MEPTAEVHMNWQQVEGQWKELGAQIKSRWAKLTDDDLMSANAKKDLLVARIQQRYGILKDEAERQVDDWIARVKSQTGPTQTKH